MSRGKNEFESHIRFVADCPNNRFVRDACVSALRASFSAPQPGRYRRLSAAIGGEDWKQGRRQKAEGRRKTPFLIVLPRHLGGLVPAL
jgi:hypothetical protein